MKNSKCVVCGNEQAIMQPMISDGVYFFACPICGRYELGCTSVDIGQFAVEFDLNHLCSYLAYNGFSQSGFDCRFFTTSSKEWCDEQKKLYEEGKRENGFPVHLAKEDVENWYPKTFTEKIDNILLYLNSHIKHLGEEYRFQVGEMHSVCFIDRYDYINEQIIDRNPEAIKQQVRYMWKYMKESGYISLPDSSTGALENKPLTITPKGYDRVDLLQRNTSNGKNVLVAMKFGDETKNLREAIRKGIQDAGYLAIFIDEVQHNDFITPELLKYIKNSKFVVVDLTHKNNGAYFEEGYAMGLGKQVIQLCCDGVELHFDIAQKNTIIWKTEEAIPKMLADRIRATID